MSELVKLADELDRLAEVEATTPDGEPDNMGESWHEYAQCFIDHHYQIVTALRLAPAALAARPDREGLLEAALVKIRDEAYTKADLEIPDCKVPEMIWQSVARRALEQGAEK